MARNTPTQLLKPSTAGRLDVLQKDVVFIRFQVRIDHSIELFCEMEWPGMVLSVIGLGDRALEMGGVDAQFLGNPLQFLRGHPRLVGLFARRFLQFNGAANHRCDFLLAEHFAFLGHALV